MIGYVRGTVAAIMADSCFVEVGGIGYRVYVSDRDRQVLVLHNEVKLITYLAVREDSLTLYGFLSQEAYELFVMLIAVSSIGPKVAMGVLSAVRPESFYLAVRNKEIGALTKLPGIGRKTAERILLELKDKIGNIGIQEDEADIKGLESDGMESEAIGALCSLGYRREEVHPVVHRLAGSCTNPSELIGAALRELGKMRI